MNRYLILGTPDLPRYVEGVEQQGVDFSDASVINHGVYEADTVDEAMQKCIKALNHDYRDDSLDEPIEFGSSHFEVIELK